jgi:hypothetical protein
MATKSADPGLGQGAGVNHNGLGFSSGGMFHTEKKP